MHILDAGVRQLLGLHNAAPTVHNSLMRTKRVMLVWSTVSGTMHFDTARSPERSHFTSIEISKSTATDRFRRQRPSRFSGAQPTAIDQCR
jgi:hypothetical protein